MSANRQNNVADVGNLIWPVTSSIDQNTDRQLENIPVNRVFTDKASGKDTHRPQLGALLEFIREGDTLFDIGLLDKFILAQ